MRLRLLLLSILAGPRALAQEPEIPPLPPPPPSYSPQYPMPPPYAVPPPAEIDALEHRGRNKLIGGNILLATGGALAISGTGLAIASLFVDNNGSCGTFDTHHADGIHHGSCGNAALAVSGGTMVLLGAAAIVPGSFMRDHGRRDLAAAQQMRSRWSAWTLQPTVSRQGALGVVKLKF